MNTAFKEARSQTLNYHIDYYSKHELFEGGSWLEKPDAIVMELCKEIKKLDAPKILDLGAGVGRNSIAIAQILNNAQIDCVEFLDLACKKLDANAAKHGVQNSIISHCLDLETFVIRKNYYDLIIAISVLEHCSSFANIETIIQKVIDGTKTKGINRLEFTTNRNVIDQDTNQKINTKVETPLQSDDLETLLKEKYKNWVITKLSLEPYKENLLYEGKEVIWQSIQLNFIAQKI
jgi:cyclopropane fatty-acyl-phospholipid synthase-like methyltransferase